MKKRGRDENKLYDVVGMLARAETLPARFCPHKLSGTRSDFWECHIEPDWLLVYDVSDEELVLVRSGTHADLFG